MDSQLRRLAVKYRCVYTRYADDLTFSTSLREFPEALAKVEATKRGNELKIGPELKHIIDLNGFEINRDKIRLQTADRRQGVTGLTVNQFPNVSRRYLSQVRAMLHAWKTHGLDNAQNEFYSLYNKKSQSPHKTDVSFANVVQGKIEFLGMVRGKHDPTYLQFLSQLAALAPDMVKRSEKDIEDERKVRIKLKEVLTELFNGGELNVLCFELGIEIENIKGSNKSEKVIELIKYIERRDRMPELVKIVTKKRPGKL
jgi:RNA-directed DNA polymerase